MATGEGGTCSIIRPVTVAFRPAPNAEIQGPSTVCVNTPQSLNVKLSGNAPFAFTYTDGNGSHTVQSIVSNTYELPVTPSGETTYSIVSVSDANCTNDRVNSTIVVHVEEALEAMRYETVDAFAYVPTDLKARQPGIGYTYHWQPDVGLNLNNVYDPVFNHGKSQEYTITLTSESGCSTVDTLLVNVVNEPNEPIKSDLYVPNAWTPNRDGVNDELYPFLVNIEVLKYFRVFNRWGQLMFEVKDYYPSGTGLDRHLRGWNGIWRDAPQVSDVYTWTAEAIGKDGRHFKKAGNAMLLR
jgi:hypothetical protein